MTQFPVDVVPTVEQAAQRAFAIHQLWREHAVDRTAALLSLSQIYRHPDARVRHLCVRIAETIGGVALACEGDGGGNASVADRSV